MLRNIVGKASQCLKSANIQNIKYYSSFLSSPDVRDINEYPEVEIFKNPPEWKYVEKLLGLPIIPQPKEKPQYPSVWKPPINTLDTYNYFIARTKNHMFPIYLKKTHRGQRIVTLIRRIEGDIWELEKELRGVIEKDRKGICASRINEMSGQIHFHGNHVKLIKHYLMKKGF